MTICAILLAAGMGKRLGGDIPKCLLELGGQSLLQNYLRELSSRGIGNIIIGTGYRPELIEAAVRDFETPAAIRLVHNPDYQLGSVVTLWRLRHELAAGDEILLMDADVLFDPRILDRLLQSGHRNCFLMDRDFVPGDEPVKLCVRDGALTEFRKIVTGQHDFCGESVGFFRFSQQIAVRLAEACQRYMDEGRNNEPHEEVLRDLLLSDPQAFGYEDITGLPWIEIDFDSDLARAEQEIFPAICNQGLRR